MIDLKKKIAKAIHNSMYDPQNITLEQIYSSIKLGKHNCCFSSSILLKYQKKIDMNRLNSYLSELNGSVEIV